MSISKLFTDINQFDNITNTGVNQGERNIIDLIKSGGQKVLDFAAPIAKDAFPKLKSPLLASLKAGSESIV